MLKNVVIVSDFGYVNGGNSKVAIDNALFLSNHYKVYFFVGESRIDERISNSNIEVISVNGVVFLNSDNKFKTFFSYVYDKRVYKAFLRLLEKLKKEETIIHIHSWSKVLSPSVLKAISKEEFKTLITCHDYFSVCPNGGLYNYKKKCICKCTNRMVCALSNCDSRSYLYKMVRNVRFSIQKIFLKRMERKHLLNFGIISKSQECLFKDVFKKSFYHYIPNNIDFFDVDKVDVNNNSKFFFIGRISEEKGIKMLVEAFGQLKSYKLDVIGDGELLGDLKNVSGDNVYFHGWKTKKEISSLIKDARCLIFPSIWYEGSPLIIPEVMSAGVPCLVSNVTNGRDFIIDGINGWLFDIKNPNDMINKIKHISTTDLNSISLEAYKIRNKNNYNDVYLKALENINEKENE